MLAGFAAYPPLNRRTGHRDKEQQYKGSGRLAAENGIDYDTLYRQDKVFPEFRTNRYAQGMQRTLHFKRNAHAADDHGRADKTINMKI